MTGFGAYNIDVGDVLAVRTSGILPALIRLGARLDHRPALDNHVVVAHHIDDAGVPWGIEGRPGGVGWADLRNYLADRHTVTTATQPKTFQQRTSIAARMVAMLGTPYDWRAIAKDATRTILPNLAALFAKDGWQHTHGSPGHVVCSSFAAYLYQTAGLARPMVTNERYCEPCDWTDFIEARRWVVAA